MQQLDLFAEVDRPAGRRRSDDRPLRIKPTAETDDLRWVIDLGYGPACRRGPAGICSVRPMFYTGALVVGISPDGHQGRYCYATVNEAARALATWDGRGDPPGNWIKFKGSCSERFGPGLAAGAR